jgi:hypothetical protein
MNYTAQLQDDGTYKLFYPQTITDINGNAVDILAPLDGTFTLDGLNTLLSTLQAQQTDAQARIDAINALATPSDAPVFVSTDVPANQAVQPEPITPAPVTPTV